MAVARLSCTSRVSAAVEAKFEDNSWAAVPCTDLRRETWKTRQKRSVGECADRGPGRNVRALCFEECDDASTLSHTPCGRLAVAAADPEGFAHSAAADWDQCTNP